MRRVCRNLLLDWPEICIQLPIAEVIAEFSRNKILILALKTVFYQKFYFSTAENSSELHIYFISWL